MASEWRNWAGDQRCSPAVIERPSTLEELIEAVGRAADRGLTAHAPGSGHSFTEAALTDGAMIRIEALNRVLDVDRDSGLVKVEAGITLRDLSAALWERGLAMENLGDIDRQTLAGAISTATHGTGAEFRNLSAQVEALELVLADGEPAGGLRADGPGRLSSGQGGARVRWGSSTRSPCAPSPASPCIASTRHARWRRPWPASTSWRRATTTSSSSSSPTPTRR